MTPRPIMIRNRRRMFRIPWRHHSTLCEDKCTACGGPHSDEKPLVVPCRCALGRYYHRDCFTAPPPPFDQPRLPDHCPSCNDDLSDREVCRICNERAALHQPLILPCACPISVGLVHRKCLTLWSEVGGKMQCSTCDNDFAFRYLAYPFDDWLKVHCRKEEPLMDKQCTSVILLFWLIAIVALSSIAITWRSFRGQATVFAIYFSFSMITSILFLHVRQHRIPMLLRFVDRRPEWPPTPPPPPPSPHASNQPSQRSTSRERTESLPTVEGQEGTSGGNEERQPPIPEDSTEVEYGLA